MLYLKYQNVSYPKHKNSSALTLFWELTELKKLDFRIMQMFSWVM